VWNGIPLSVAVPPRTGVVQVKPSAITILSGRSGYINVSLSQSVTVGDNLSLQIISTLGSVTVTPNPLVFTPSTMWQFVMVNVQSKVRPYETLDANLTFSGSNADFLVTSFSVSVRLLPGTVWY